MITAARAVAKTAGEPYRVMIVDDSAVVRGLIRRWLDEDGRIRVVSTFANGEMALQGVKNGDPEIAVLDIEMPVMDGMTALPKLLAASPDLKVIMASTLTLEGARISLDALALGAADYLPKPQSLRGQDAPADFRRELAEKVVNLGAAVRRTKIRREAREASTAAEPLERERAVLPLPRPEITLRDASRYPAKILAIGSSTGGPQALLRFFEGFRGRLRVPAIITQHMPATFTKILAEHLAMASGQQAKEAENGEAVEPGHIYVAPGGFHLLVEKQGEGKMLRLTEDAPENFCRPAADPMFRSVAEAYGCHALAVVLTGMGHDGLAGARAIVEAGGTIIAQDEETSVVWGMPGAVATAGLCSAVRDIPGLVEATGRMIAGERP